MTVLPLTQADTVLLRDEILKAERDLERLRYATPKSVGHAHTIRTQIQTQERHIDRLKGMLT